MGEHFKKARLVTVAMMAAVCVMGVAALTISERHGYGASSEAKMNFLRLIVFIVSFVQIVMAGALKKIITAATNKQEASKRFFAAQITANALCEAPAIFGLVLTMVSKTFMDYAILGSISLVALLIFFPREKRKES